MDIIALYNDYSIPYLTEGHYHCRSGWVQVACPFCSGNPGWHMGYSLEDNFYSCWRCGGHFTDQVIAELLQISTYEAKKIIKQYEVLTPAKKEPVGKIRIKAHKLPSNSNTMLTNHRTYLRNRGFDPEYLERLWGLLGTGPISKLDNLDYKHRIIIPFIWEGKQVSFDSRDITNKHMAKYMACPKDRELISHKSIIYCDQQSLKDSIVCVEGSSDVWRFGKQSGATSGIKYTPKQVRELAKFKRVFIVFDPDPQALIQANKLRAELRFRNVDAHTITGLDKDPGEMSQTEADYLVKQLIH